MSFDVDGVVETLYREAHEDSASPPGVGPLLRALLGHRVRVFEWKDHHAGWQRLPYDRWDVYVPAGACPAERGNALAEMLACRAVATRFDYEPQSTPELRLLAEAVVLPTPAARGWAAELDVDEIASTLVTTTELVERRLELAGVRSSPRLSCARQAPVFAPDFSAPRPLAKISCAAGIVHHLSDYRARVAGVGLGRTRKL